MTTTLERWAKWASALRIDDVPEHVLSLCRAQRRSVAHACQASLGVSSAGRVLRAVESSAPDGPAQIPGVARSIAVEQALAGATALSMALDFDDYLFFGHTGHSAVLVPQLLQSETGAEDDALLLAQLAANELGARLGGAAVIGPLNGQMWSFVHAVGAAVAAGMVLGLGERALAHAMAIALYQPPRPTPPGFCGPDSKLLTATAPAQLGLQAARMAAHDVTGPLDILDHPDGFFSAFSFAPVRDLLELGDGWATRTLCIKPYPGCAYIDTTMDALLSLGSIESNAVERIDVDAGVLTCGMDALARRSAGRRPTAVNINFSLSWNVAIGIVAGRLTEHELQDDWLMRHRAELDVLARKVSLRHEWSYTEKTLTALEPVLSPTTLPARLGLRALLTGLGRMHAVHPSSGLKPWDGARFLDYLRRERTKTFHPWNDAALQRVKMSFPARVAVHLRGGQTLEAEAITPRGASGHPTIGPLEVRKASSSER